MQTIKEMLEKAGQLLDANQLMQAKDIYLASCQIQDNHEARHMLGAIAAEQGDVADAIKNIRTAIELKPDYADAYVTLGSIHMHVNEFNEAHSCFQKATEFDDGYEEAWNLLSASFGHRGDYKEAERCARKALLIDPQYKEARVNLANSLKSQGNVKEAISSYREIIKDGMYELSVLQSLAQSYIEDNQLENAEEILQKALQVQPTNTEIMLLLADVLFSQGESEQAQRLYTDTLEISPGSINALIGNAMVAADHKDFTYAAGQFESILKNNPDEVMALSGLSKIYYNEGRMLDAVQLNKRIIDIVKPEDVGHLNKIRFEAFSNYVFSLNYLPNTSPEQMSAEHSRWASEYSSTNADFTFPNELDEDKILKIGYISPDFRRHSVAFFIEPLLVGHHRENFEVYCYSNTDIPDDTTHHLQSLSDQWRDISTTSDDDVIERIKEDKIDILVDLAGHTTNNRLGVFAQRAAPVQVTYLGYPNTTGLMTMDYRISDNYADPESSENNYTEELLRVPDSFICYSAPTDTPDISSTPALSNGYITFGSFNAIQKVTDEVVLAWAEILNQVPGSRIILKNPSFAHDSVRRRIMGAIKEQGIEENRIKLLDVVKSYKEHMSLYGEIDIALDTFPYNGTTTTCEALWMGVPVITLMGDVHANNVSKSILKNLSHEEWIAKTSKNYIELAVEAAKDINQLNVTRLQLRERLVESPLCNQEQFVENIESIYRKIWKQYCETNSI